MELGLSFDDIALKPAAFSTIKSRADVDVSETIGQTILGLPIISSNMTSVYSPKLSTEVSRNGGISIVHRFCTISENEKLFKDGSHAGIVPWVSIGAKKEELLRAEALVSAGAKVLVLDLAMGNSLLAVKQFQELKRLFPNHDIIVSDFCHKEQLDAFVFHAGACPTAFTLGQGIGSACRTRKTTGIGYPSVSAIMDCAREQRYNLILNGGIRDTDDFCKALALGCKAVIVGRGFAGCFDSGAEKICIDPNGKIYKSNEPRPIDLHLTHALYKGSAAASSYKEQGKESSFRAPEGEEYYIPITGTVKELMDKFNGGLCSSLSYLNANNLNEFRANAKLIQVTTHGSKESVAYGKYE